MSTAVGSKPPRPPIRALAMLLSLVAIVLVAARASFAPATSQHGAAVFASENELPLAVEEGSAQCRVAAARPAGDGRAPSGARVRGLSLGPSRPVTAIAPEQRSMAPGTTSAAGSPPETSAVRRHARLMVFLI